MVALLTAEAATERAARFIGPHSGRLLVSNLAAAEFASAISRHVRMRQMPVDEARDVLLAFDRWIAAAADSVETDSADIALATAFLRRLDLNLRTPDAIHIAVAQRLGASLVTFDREMAAAAKRLGVALAEA